MATVLLEFEDQIANLRLNRPEKLNAIDVPMLDELSSACKTIEKSQARVVILSGKGKSFCAGGDIEAWGTQSAEIFSRHWVREGHAVFDQIARLRQAVIAVLDGHVLGGGLELAACADLRIAETHIKIGQPEAGLGIIPGWSGTQRAARRFGSQGVRRMALFGEVFNAEEALALGIVDQVVDTGDGHAAASGYANKILARSPRASELTKMLINAAEGEERERVLDAFAGAAAASSEDLLIGLSAFRENRKPDFDGEKS